MQPFPKKVFKSQKQRYLYLGRDSVLVESALRKLPTESQNIKFKE